MDSQNIITSVSIYLKYTTAAH